MELGVLILPSSSFGVAFVRLRQYLSYRPQEEDRIFRLLDYASSGSPGHGPIHLLIKSAEEIGLFLAILSRPVGFGLAFPRCV